MNFLMKINRIVSLLVVCLFLTYHIAFADTPVTIYTPEGCPVTAYVISDGTPWYTDAMALDDIDLWGLEAEIIATATAFYNCHGYAWSKSENIGTYWIGYTDNEEETKFFTDGDYSNDNQPSYVSASSSEAMHGCYEQHQDHSIRVIQNGYPVSINPGKPLRTHVSKWGSGPLVRHEPGHDVYALKNTGIISYYKLKTTHYGTLTNYPKTWIGNNGTTHTITGNVTIPANKNLTITGDVTIERSNQSYNVKFSPGTSTIVVKGNMNVSGSEDNLFKFTSNSASPSRTDWGGFLVEDGGSINLDYCEIADATAGIQTAEIEEFSVKNSRIHHTNYHGILVEIPWGKTADILNNYIYNNARAGILTVPRDGTVNIKNNVIYDNYDHGMFVQVYRGYIYNNTVTNNNDGIWVGGSSGPSIIYVKNNIVASNNLSGYGSEHYGIWSGTSTGTEILTYNDVFNNSSGNYYGCSPGTGSISADPLFSDASSDDYRLNYTSPCIDKGDPGSPNDPDGTRADMGAYYLHHLEGTLDNDITLSKDAFVIGDLIAKNITVLSGATLKVVGGSNIFFNQGAKLKIYGTLDAEGIATHNKIKFTRSDPDNHDKDYWQGIWVYSGGNIDIEKVHISGAYNGVGFYIYDDGACNILFTTFDENYIGLYTSTYHSDIDVTYCDFTNNIYGAKDYFSDVNLTGCDFEDNTYGAYFYGSKVNLMDCAFEDNTYGAFINYCSNHSFIDNYYNGNSYGIYFNRSGGSLKGNNFLCNNSAGIYCTNYSDPMLVIPHFSNSPSPELNNIISGGPYYGVYNSGNSSVMLGMIEYGPGYLWGYFGFNHFLSCGPGYDVYNASSNAVYAEANWWGSDGCGSPRTYGNVYTFPRVCDINFGGMPKSSSGEQKPDTLDLLLLSAYNLEMKGRYPKAIKVLNDIADFAPGNAIAYPVVSSLVRNYQQIKSVDKLINNLDNLYQKYPEKRVGISAFDYSVTISAGEGDFNEALSRSEKVINIYTSNKAYNEEAAWAIFEQGMIYETIATQVGSGMNKTTDIYSNLSQKNFLRIQSEYPETEAAKLIQTGKDINVKEMIEETEQNAGPEKFALYPAYPNPFNSSTCISFGLPEEADVNIIIYDILGREIWSCKQKNFSKGKHSIIWDGMNSKGAAVSTGMYIVKIVTDKFVKSRKVMMLK